MFSYSNLILSKKFLDYKLNFINYKLFWSTFRATKIVLQGESTAHLFDIEELAKKAHIPHYLVHDAGKTQVCNLFCSNRMPETCYFPNKCLVKAKFSLLTDGCGTLFLYRCHLVH